jgi:hypothetical protein
MSSHAADLRRIFDMLIGEPVSAYSPIEVPEVSPRLYDALDALGFDAEDSVVMGRLPSLVQLMRRMQQATPAQRAMLADGLRSSRIDNLAQALLEMDPSSLGGTYEDLVRLVGNESKARAWFGRALRATPAPDGDEPGAFVGMWQEHAIEGGRDYTEIRIDDMTQEPAEKDYHFTPITAAHVRG